MAIEMTKIKELFEKFSTQEERDRIRKIISSYLDNGLDSDAFADFLKDDIKKMEREDAAGISKESKEFKDRLREIIQKDALMKGIFSLSIVSAISIEDAQKEGNMSHNFLSELLLLGLIKLEREGLISIK